MSWIMIRIFFSFFSGSCWKQSHLAPLNSIVTNLSSEEA